VRADELKHRLRERLPARLQEWMSQRLRQDGLTTSEVDERLRGLKLSFEPADIVNEVMSFGSPTPVEVAVSGPSFADNRAYADKLRAELAKIPALVDLHLVQSLDYPALAVEVDRERAGLSGVTTSDVAQSLVPATSSSRFTVPVFWADPKTGIGYQVQVEVPPYQISSAEQIEMLPIKNRARKPLLLRDVAGVQSRKVVGEYDRYNMRRAVSMTANIEGTDLGRVAGDLSRALQTVNESLWSESQNAAGKPGWKNAITDEFVDSPARPTAPPRGLQVDIRGQVVPMQQIFGALGGGGLFEGMTIGLIMALVVVFLLLTAYFQSVRLALASVSTVPAVFAGACILLAITGTRLNIQSLVGLIMASGVAAANAILLTTFADRIRREGKPATEAGKEAAHRRLRPLLMTSFAMIAGMLPMAVGWGEAGEQTAPLGRAVVGGLLASMTAKLLVLPSMFAVVMGRGSTDSASLDPDDPASTYFDHAR
jgi:multidrug efflux pump subunit AcrB